MSDTNKFTKGEWKVVGFTGLRVYAGEDKGSVDVRKLIAECSTYGISEKEAKENAKLIAAAPDMLATLREVHDVLLLCTLIDKTNTSQEAFNLVESTLKKATS